MFEELNKRRQAVIDNIAKSFENDIEKALGAGYDPEGGDGDKQTEIEDKLRFYVRHYNIDEKEWNEIVKPYAEGLSGLPYEDFK